MKNQNSCEKTKRAITKTLWSRQWSVRNGVYEAGGPTNCILSFVNAIMKVCCTHTHKYSYILKPVYECLQLYTPMAIAELMSTTSISRPQNSLQQIFKSHRFHHCARKIYKKIQEHLQCVDIKVVSKRMKKMDKWTNKHNLHISSAS